MPLRPPALSLAGRHPNEGRARHNPTSRLPVDLDALEFLPESLEQDLQHVFDALKQFVLERASQRIPTRELAGELVADTLLYVAWMIGLYAGIMLASRERQSQDDARQMAEAVANEAMTRATPYATEVKMEHQRPTVLLDAALDALTKDRPVFRATTQVHKNTLAVIALLEALGLKGILVKYPFFSATVAGETRVTNSAQYYGRLDAEQSFLEGGGTADTGWGIRPLLPRNAKTEQRMVELGIPDGFRSPFITAYQEAARERVQELLRGR